MLVGSMLLGAACATPPNAGLERAEARYASAAQDPQVTAQAPVELHEAEKALERARRAFREDAEEEEVEHLAYLAARRVEIAEAVADRNAALQRTELLAEERDQARIDAAERRAESSERQAETLAAELAELEARETERGLLLTVGDVLFAVDRADLQPGAYPPLSRLAEYLVEHPELSVSIEGHTDSTGSAAYNLELSQARAEAVRGVLVGQGVDPRRISVRGLGFSAPVASNATEAGRQQNRRVEVVIGPPADGTASVR
jgi:outer membrane protein OmpA-like peptidoglycan-associated protein